MKNCLYTILVCALINSFVICNGQQAIEDSMHHVRNGQPREWSEFPINAKEKELSIHFSSKVNTSDQTISLRQYDVKLDWRVVLNGLDIGSLATDENDMTIYLAVPPGTLRDGQNELLIKCTESIPDDIRVGEIKIDPRPLIEVLSDGSVEIQIFDSNTDKFLPSRITIINDDGVLQTVSSSGDKQLAIRPGVVYTATGKALLKFPSGRYKIYSGRGFEYGIDSADVVIKPGDHIKKILRIKKEVLTDGWISSDTHIHTFTHSRHGDATTEERAITIAGEGIELPILTDHNIHVDLGLAASATGVRNYFTPVVGDELTTKFGHFNVFKLATNAPVADHNVKDWNDAILKIHDPDKTKAVILNHARDVHYNFRPFGPERHLSSAGVNKDDWVCPANAMEVINSGSQQSNFMNLYNDWFGMLNHGVYLTPVGSSDSHDVSRYIVGQGRTYIESDDTDPGTIDVDGAIKNFRNGKVMVSLGLLTKIIVNNRYGPGELVPFSNKLTVAVEVHGPAWVTADRVSLFVNGKKIKETKIDNAAAGSLKWKGSWEISLPRHDIFIVAVAEGPGSGMPFWPIAKPYQPASSEWTPRVIGSTGAVWIDADKNRKRDSAYDYAQVIMNSAGGDIYKIVNLLNDYDAAVGAQVAALLWKEKRDLNSHQIQEALSHAKEEIRNGFEKVMNEIKTLEK
jgi:hypothetical protein